MSLTNVWLDTLADGLIRANTIIGVGTHRTPSVAGKPSRWLLDVVLAASTSSGLSDSWILGPLHRTLIQTDHEPRDAPGQLVRLLAQLDATNAVGVVTVTPGEPEPDHDTSPARRGFPSVRLRYTPFPATEAGRHYDARYLLNPPRSTP